METNQLIHPAVTHVGVILAQIVAISIIVVIYTIIFIKGKEFYNDLRGEDQRWQALELSIVIWSLLFPAITICCVLGLHVPLELWGAMDTVFLISVGAKVMHEKKYKNEEHNDQTSP